VDISSDGTLLAVGTADGTVQLWDTGTGEPVGEPIRGPEGYVNSLKFSPDGNTLAAGLTSGQTWVWDITNRLRPVTSVLLQTPTQAVWAVAYSPDGRSLAATQGDIVLLDHDAGRVARTVCDTAGSPITETEWNRQVPGTSYRPIC
jgi:WD40 repeat protein